MSLDLLYVLGLDGNINNLNPSTGFYTGLKVKDGLFTVGGNVGMDCNYKEAVTYNVEGNVGFNAENGTRYDDLQDGLFAKGSIKSKVGFDSEIIHERYQDYEVDNMKTGTEYNGEIGLRFNSYKSTHTNISAVGQYDDYGGKKSSFLAGKLERSDGNKDLYIEGGLDNKAAPVIGVGADLRFGF